MACSEISYYSNKSLCYLSLKLTTWNSFLQCKNASFTQEVKHSNPSKWFQGSRFPFFPFKRTFFPNPWDSEEHKPIESTSQGNEPCRSLMGNLPLCYGRRYADSVSFCSHFQARVSHSFPTRRGRENKVTMTIMTPGFIKKIIFWLNKYLAFL